MTTNKCDHAPDWSTVTPADGAPGIVDVCCRKCRGCCGSVRIDPDDIDWGEEDDDGTSHEARDSGTN